MKERGFTLIELIVVIAITAILSAIILFGITQYISKGKDSNIAGNLAVLVPAGEVFYNGNYSSYSGFCESTVVENAVLQMPQNTNEYCFASNPAGLCCHVNDSGNKWAACAQEFSNRSYAYCVDSRGVKKEICSTDCNESTTECPQNVTLSACE